MTEQDRLRKAVRKAYKPTASREYTDTEVDYEIERLKREVADGTADDFSLALYCQLGIDENKGRY